MVTCAKQVIGANCLARSWSVADAENESQQTLPVNPFPL